MATELPEDFPDWLNRTNSRQFSRPPMLMYQLWKECYPDQPFSSEDELLQMVLRNHLQMHTQGMAPEDIFRNLLAWIENCGGMAPIASFGDEDDRRLAAFGDGRVLEFGLTEEQQMEIRELSREDFEEMSREELVERMMDVQESLSN